MVEGFYLLLAYTDILVLKQFRPPDEVAVYYAAAKTLALVSFIYFSVAAATAHRFSAYHVAGDRAGLSRFLTQTIRWTFWPSLAATALLLVFGQPILSLFGPQFTDGYPLMVILAVGPRARSSRTSSTSPPSRSPRRPCSDATSAPAWCGPRSRRGGSSDCFRPALSTAATAFHGRCWSAGPIPLRRSARRWSTATLPRP